MSQNSILYTFYTFYIPILDNSVGVQVKSFTMCAITQCFRDSQRDAISSVLNNNNNNNRLTAFVPGQPK